MNKHRTLRAAITCEKVSSPEKSPVAQEAEQPFDENLASELEAAQKALDDDVANARAEIVYPQGLCMNSPSNLSCPWSPELAAKGVCSFSAPRT